MAVVWIVKLEKEAPAAGAPAWAPHGPPPSPFQNHLSMKSH